MAIYALPHSSLFRGSLYALAAFFLMAVFGVLTKAAAAHASIFWVSFISYLVGLLLMLPILKKKGTEFLKTSHLSYHLGRVGFGLAASLLYTLSLRYIPLVNATLLFNTTPLFIPILAIFMLNQRASLRTWISILIGFIGIMIIIKPTQQIFDQVGDLIGLASGISLAIAYVFIKKLAPTDSLEAILFYFFFFATCIQSVFIPFLGPMPSYPVIAEAVAAGAAFFLAQLSLVKAYEYASASEVGTFQYSSVIFVGILDWMIWNQVPPFSDLLGVLLVIIAGLLIIREAMKSQRIPFNIQGKH
ncbi:DMT family transporter [Candidatus Protochlamydia phocaeensis]|uniref:DMT family transporter n=1 Tax=Candidatus Protochlamydia phocaeensis TaxID=1414722 RepID=UPI000837BF13|nr:DMT family transporter [Candidatus Protochlamydia phocaeensis]